MTVLKEDFLSGQGVGLSLQDIRHKAGCLELTKFLWLPRGLAVRLPLTFTIWPPDSCLALKLGNCPHVRTATSHLEKFVLCNY